MTSIQRTLMIIAIFLTLAIGSFIWFVVSWDKTQTKTLGALTIEPMQTASLFSVPKNPGGWGSATVLHHPQAGQPT